MPPESPPEREPPLVRLQRRFWALITAPAGVRGGMAKLAGPDPDAVPLGAWVRADDEEGAVRRFDVYAQMYFFRLLDAIRADLPKVAAVLGDGPFQNLITDYLLVHPSGNPSLRHAAASLPEFLETPDQRERYRLDLADLARLDLARLDAFFAPDAATLGRAALQSVPPAAWPDLRLRLAPSTRLLRLDTGALDMWSAVDEGRPVPPGDRGVVGALVWRAGFKVLHRRTRATEHEALLALDAGEPFSLACEILANDTADEGPPPEQAVLAALGRWLDDGIFADPGLGP